MNEIIQTTLDGFKRDDPKWKRQPFVKRKELYRDLMVEYATQYCPHETPALRQVAADSGDLHWRRNTVVHGSVAILGEKDDKSPTGHSPVFKARGWHKGKPTEIDLDEPTLTTLWHDIAHLGGALMTVYLQMGGVASGPIVIIEDREFLQGPRAGSFRTVPIPSKRPLPSDSSEE